MAQQARTIRGYGFHGMSNLPRPPGALLDENRLITPRYILNADVRDGGVLIKRNGYRRTVALSGCHSLWSGSVMLCVATGADGGPSLFRIGGATATEIAPISGPAQARMEYAENYGIVYISNGYWHRTYRVDTQLLTTWGLPIPIKPSITEIDGDLPPGAYKVCYTYFEAPNRLGGNSEIAEVQWSGDTRGIQLVNKLSEMPLLGTVKYGEFLYGGESGGSLVQDSGMLVWITQPNGSEFYLATVNDDNSITLPYYSQPLPTFGVQPPEPMVCLAAAHGRIWGVRGKKLIYSDEFQFENFRAGNFFSFPEDLTLVVQIDNGLWVNSRHTTWLLKGTQPEKMALEVRGDGAIPGSLTYAVVYGPGGEILRGIPPIPCPVWLGPQGVMVGLHSGNLMSLTESRVRLNLFSQGAACYRNHNGTSQIVMSTYGNQNVNFDDVLHTIFERGRIYV